MEVKAIELPEEEYDEKAIEAEEQKVKEEGKKLYAEIKNKAINLETQLKDVHAEISEKERKLREIADKFDKAEAMKELSTEEELEKLKEIEEILEKSKQITERQKTLNDSFDIDSLLAEVNHNIENKEN